MKVAIIPARGGSKRIPRKNVKPFCGFPMIAWPIAAARRSGVFTRIVVSTDDPEIAEIARQYGAEVPFTRPRELADDHTPLVPVIRHAIGQAESSDDPIELVCCIYATAPFLTAELLQAGCEVFSDDAALEFAFGITSFEFSIHRALKVDATGQVQMFWPENELRRSQDLPHAFHDAGQFTWGRREAWLTRDRIFSSRSKGILLPRHLAQDIDTPEDWAAAEWNFRSREQRTTP